MIPWLLIAQWFKANWKIVALITIVLAIFYSGWYAHGVIYAAEKAAAIEAQAKADKEAQAATNKLLEDTQSKLAAERKKTLSLTQKWNATRANTADCPLPDAGLGLFREAIGTAIASP